MTTNQSKLIPEPRQHRTKDRSLQASDAEIQQKLDEIQNSRGTTQIPRPAPTDEVLKASLVDDLARAAAIRELEFFAKHFKLKWQFGEHGVNPEALPHIVKYLADCFSRHIARRNSSTTTHIRGPVQGISSFAYEYLTIAVQQPLSEGLSLDNAMLRIDNAKFAAYIREKFPGSASSKGCASFYKNQFKRDFLINKYAIAVLDALLEDLPITQFPTLPKTLLSLGNLGSYFTKWLDANRRTFENYPEWDALCAVLLALCPATNLTPPEARGGQWTAVAATGAAPETRE